MIGILIKVGQEEHLKRFQNEGMLHCETLDFFANIEDCSLRGDNLETATKFFNTGNYVLTIFNEETSAEYVKIKVEKACFSEQNQSINLFCLYAEDIFNHDEDTPFMLEQRFSEEEWGTHFIIITQPAIFIERVKRTLIEMNLGFTADLVRYADLANYNGDNDGFIKDVRYSYQKEFRIRIKNNELKCLNIFIDNISAITSPIYTLELLKTLKMYYKQVNRKNFHPH